MESLLDTVGDADPELLATGGNHEDESTAPPTTTDVPSLTTIILNLLGVGAQDENHADYLVALQSLSPALLQSLLALIRLACSQAEAHGPSGLVATLQRHLQQAKSDKLVLEVNMGTSSFGWAVGL